MKATVQRGSKASQRPMPQAMHAKTSRAPSAARRSAPVERCVALLGLWATTTVLEWTVVVGAVAVGVVAVGGTVGVVVGVGVVPVVEVELGAIVPGWAPLTGVVLVGVVAAGTLDVGTVVAGAGVVEAVVPWTRAVAGIWIFRIEPMRLVELAAEAGAALASRHSIALRHMTRARTLGRSRARAQVSP